MLLAEISQIDTKFHSFMYPLLLASTASIIPHLIKLLRNRYIDHRFTLDNGTKITKTTIETLLEMDNNETKICHHLPPNDKIWEDGI